MSYPIASQSLTVDQSRMEPAETIARPLCAEPEEAIITWHVLGQRTHADDIAELLPTARSVCAPLAL
jgi:hypothetical protein